MSGKRKPEKLSGGIGKIRSDGNQGIEQSGVTGYVPIDGNQGSIIGKGFTKENPVLISTDCRKSNKAKAEDDENQSQAQDAIDYSKFPISKPRKCKSGEQSGPTGNVLINGIQGITIDKGIPKKNP
eukprot:7142883-Ditylum_brightwellii.AAC.1